MKVAVFGNCQSEPLLNFLKIALHDEAVDIRLVSNYLDNSPETLSFLGQAQLLFEQVTLEAQSKLPLTDSQKKKIPTIKFPFVSCSFLWPYEQAHPKNQGLLPYLPMGPYPADFGNMFINRMLSGSDNSEEIITRWFDTDLKQLVNLDRVFETTRLLTKRTGTLADFCMWDEIESTFRTEQLFYTVRHPTMRLHERMIYRAMDILKLQLPQENILQALYAGRMDVSPAHHPIHPAIIQHFGLTWCDGSTRYRYFDEDWYTYDEFARRYIRYEYDDDLLRGTSLTREQKDLPLAESLIRSGLERHPRSSYGYSELASNLVQQGRTEDALHAAERAVQLSDIPRFLQQLLGIEQRLGLNERVERTARMLRQSLAR